MKERLRSIRYGIGDVVFAVFAPFRKLSVIARRRLAAVIVLAAALILFFTVAVPALPCQFPGGDSCPPPDDAVGLVPADALAYLHANLDPDTDEYEALADIAAATPLFSGQIVQRALGLLSGPGGGALDFDAEVRPWFGGEAAVAVLDGATGPEAVELLEVSDADGADKFAEGMSGAEVTSEQINGFLVLGPADGVEAIAQTAAGADGADDTGSLGDDEMATDLRAALPEHRVVDAWVSADGIDELIAGQRGNLGRLTPLLAPGASLGAAASLGAEGDAIDLAVRSALDPKLAKQQPGFFDAFPGFEPKLPEKLPGGSLGYLGFGDPGRTVRSLLTQAGAEAPGVASGFADLADQLQEQAGIDIAGELLGSLGDEAALALDSSQAASDSSSVAEPFPYLSFASTGVDEDRAREALAALQGPLGDVSQEREIEGVEARTLQVSPSLALTYAIFDGILAVSTSPDGIAGLVEAGGDDDGDGLDQSDRFRKATEGFPDEVSLLGYLDLGGVVTIGEQLGLAEDPVYATFAGEFRRLDALGFAVTDNDDMLATDARLLIGDAPAADAPAPLPAPAD